MTLLDPEVESASGSPDDAEALIKEARRLRRRRWIVGTTITALAAGAGAVGYLIASGPPAASHRPAPPNNPRAPSSSASARAVAATRSPDLIQPTTLAVLPDGNLLILDSSRDQILQLNRNGALSVFAGDGRPGFTGDGGQARDAELNFTYFAQAGMALTPNGAVDVLDNGNCRIRQINPDGVIRTILRVPLVKAHPHGACPISGVAVSPTGSIYVSTGTEIERLSAGGHLVWVAGKQGDLAHEPSHPTPSSVVFSPDALAFDRVGDLYISSFEPRVIYRLTPAGTLTNLGGSYATELALDSNDQILAGTHFGVIQQTASDGLRSFYSVDPRRVEGINWGKAGFQENGIAVTKTGTIYVDNAQGNGYGDGTVLVRISPAKRAALVPIRTPLAATLPKIGAPGFPTSLYPPATPSQGPALSSCPSDQGLEPFTPAATLQARTIARTYLSSQFASDITVTDRSWWTADFNHHTSADDLGRHTVTRQLPTSNSPHATRLAQACGRQLVQDSTTVAVGKSAYSNFAGTLYFLNRDGHPLLYDLR